MPNPGENSTGTSCAPKTIDGDHFLIQWKYWGFGYQVRGKTKDITDLEMRYYTVEDERGTVENPYCCVIWEGVKQHKFGSWLREPEQEWLLAEISHFPTLSEPQSN